MNVARGHNKLGNVPEAADALDRMINNYSQTLLAPDAYLKLAQTHASLVDGPYYDQGATKEAITYYTDFMLLFPTDMNIADAEKGLDAMKTMLAESKMKMADFYFYKRNNFRAARVFYNEAITAYPESAISQKAKGRLAEMEAKISGAATSDTTRKKRFFFF
jgi:outer membrane protein assembly factor BamD